MKRAFLTLMVGMAVAALAGCSSHRLIGPHKGTCQSAPETCATCGPGTCPHCAGDPNGDPNGGGPIARHMAEREAYRGAAPGPLTGAVAYPYYTTRGPRDFLARNPGSIGP
jgi:hypothetical protein